MSDALTITPTQIVPQSLTDFWTDTQRLLDRIQARAYQIFQERGFRDGFALDDWLNAERESLTPVSINVSSDAGTVTVRAQTPGFSAEDLKVDLLPGTLTIRGEHHEKKPAKGNNGKEERNYSFYSEVALPTNVIPEKAVATLKNGVLELTVPKAKPALQIQVKAA